MFVTGRVPYPVERNLLVCGYLEVCLESRIQGHRQIETQELNVVYQAPKESLFCGAIG